MSIGDIAEIIHHRIRCDVYKVARRILNDSNEGKIKLCSCKEDINRIIGICKWLEEKEYRKVTPSQHYVFGIFVAENIIQYGEITDEMSVINLFHKILYS